MSNILWIGGSSCSGKSTCAQVLAERHHLELVRTDDLCFGRFLFDNPRLDSFPALKRYKDLLLLGMDAFAQTDVSVSFEAFLSCCEEVFPLLLEDLETRGSDRILLVEGAHVLPALAQRFSLQPCCFLTGSKEQQHALWRQEMEGRIPGGHPAEREGFQNAKNKALVEQTRIEFHHRIAQHIEASARESGLKNLRVNQDKTIDELVSLIEGEFNLR